MHPITILILTFSSVSQNFVSSQYWPASPYWATDEPSAFKIQNNSISSDPPKIGQGISYGAMWIDGFGLNTGEHLWTFIFRGENSGASVGLSNKTFFDGVNNCKGVFYNGNLSTCSGRTLVQNFGPGIHNDTVIHLLISFTESKGRLKIYYNQDGLPLGLAYDIPANAIPNLCPVVRFSGVGSATIHKIRPSLYPIPKERDKKTYEGFNGLWKLDVQNGFIKELLTSQQEPENKFDGVPPAILEIKSDTFDLIDIHISFKVVNRYEFNATRTSGSWENSNLGFSTDFKSVGKAKILEDWSRKFIRQPHTISINSKGQLEMADDHGIIKMIWDRYDDSPAPFIGYPFE